MGCKIEIIKFHGYNIQLTRRSFQKKLRLSVHTSGAIKASANRTTSKKQVLTFLESQKDWIAKSIEEVNQIKIRFPEKKFVSGEKYFYLGLDYELVIIYGMPLKIEFENKKLNFNVPENELVVEKRKKYLQVLKKSYRQVAVELMSQRMEYYSHKMNLQPRSLHFRGQKSIWGSCTPENKINLNYKLIVAPLEIIDYVIIHELAHIRFKNHSKNFWQLVEKYTEHRQFAKKWLHENQYESQFL